MRADPTAQLRLLDLQALDSEADQLRHQRGHLPELAEIAVLTASRDETRGRRADRQIVVDDLTRAQAKADADVEQVRARRARDRDRMDQGLITNPKDLERMQGELVSLERRISDLEDVELEIMEQLEEAQASLESLTRQLEAEEARLATLITSRDQALAVVQERLDAVQQQRGPVLDDLPDDLVALYERLRSTKNGVGAAELRARQCGGCRLALDAAELGEIRAADPDLVVRHEECQRILVRTAESGL